VDGSVQSGDINSVHDATQGLIRKTGFEAESVGYASGDHAPITEAGPFKVAVENTDPSPDHSPDPSADRSSHPAPKQYTYTETYGQTYKYEGREAGADLGNSEGKVEVVERVDGGKVEVVDSGKVEDLGPAEVEEWDPEEWEVLEPEKEGSGGIRVEPTRKLDLPVNTGDGWNTFPGTKDSSRNGLTPSRTCSRPIPSKSSWVRFKPPSRMNSGVL
jgi:hypothetical protein